MAVPLHVGDVGTIIRMRVREDGAVKDMTAASALQIEVTKPSGTVVVETATLSTNGSDGRIQFTVEAGLLDEPGLYQFQGVFTIGGWSGVTSEKTVQVKSR